MKDSEVLQKARDLISDPVVWVGHAPTREKGQHCALTAILFDEAIANAKRMEPCKADI